MLFRITMEKAIKTPYLAQCRIMQIEQDTLNLLEFMHKTVYLYVENNDLSLQFSLLDILKHEYSLLIKKVCMVANEFSIKYLLLTSNQENRMLRMILNMNLSQQSYYKIHLCSSLPFCSFWMFLTYFFISTSVSQGSFSFRLPQKLLCLNLTNPGISKTKRYFPINSLTEHVEYTTTFAYSEQNGGVNTLLPSEKKL